MEDEYGLARCGIPCFLCQDKEKCGGCYSTGCTGQVWCSNRKCSENKEISGCHECDEACREGVFGRVKHKAFREFAKRYGKEKLVECLKRNEECGIHYVCDGGYLGSYDGFDDVEKLVEFILTGTR